MSAVIRVLLIEDDELVALATSTLLSVRSPAIVVTSAPTLADGLKLLATEHWDVVILDLVLPCVQGVKGVEAVAAAYPEVPIIVVTGGGAAEAKDVYAAGARGYLVKSESGLYDRLVAEIGLCMEYKSIGKQLTDSGVHLDRALESMGKPKSVPPPHPTSTVVACDTEEVVPEELIAEIAREKRMPIEEVREMVGIIMARKRRKSP